MSGLLWDMGYEIMNGWMMSNAETDNEHEV